MNRDRFVDEHLDSLLNDHEVNQYLTRASPEQRSEMEDMLRQSLGSGYETLAKEYHESKGLGSYFATALKWTGTAFDAVGTYAFWALGGAGLGLKAVGMGLKTGADALDAKYFAQHASEASLGDGVALASEGLAERIAAYLPLGVGEITDALRGRSKYDAKVNAHAVSYAKREFLNRFGEERLNIVPLERFRNPLYSLDAAVDAA
ncbi:hypothetical protein COV20_00570 [Candidatus Woesearchaeota archaeon CG10_big_fil_rev_8_21_14_0_10_45_16]|nr:MAG: hypothetical protein COV20_00570 [Candidatus Woesearchaeota archaeon CG10_big_fil_rev_8_21_14_0_10_45_16]